MKSSLSLIIVTFLTLYNIPFSASLSMESKDMLLGSRPNIIMVLADDLGWQDVGFNGCSFYETPNIDSLAKDGIISRHFYAGGPTCSPSRATLQTGTFSTVHHLYEAGGYSRGKIELMEQYTPMQNKPKPFHSSHNKLPKNMLSVADVLKSKGYMTALIGKWHLGQNRGYDIFDSCPGFIQAGLKGSACLPGQSSNRPTVSDNIIKKSLEFIDERVAINNNDNNNNNNNNNPFFLLVSHYDVHLPIQANVTDVNYYTNKKKKSFNNYINYNPGYAAMISNVDKSVGLLRKRLKYHNLEENTIFFFLSDNGACAHITPSPFRGTKGTLYDGGLRVPFIVSWKNKLQCNKELKGTYGMVDLLPTIAELAGFSRNDLNKFLNNDLQNTIKQPIDGNSILTFLKNNNYLKSVTKIKYSAKNYHIISLNDILIEEIGHENENDIDFLNSNFQKSHDNNTILSTLSKFIIWHQPHYLSKYVNKYPEQNAPFGSIFNRLNIHGTWRSVPNSAILYHNFKLMKFWGPHNKTLVHLFDLYHDPGESNNVVMKYPKIVNYLETLLNNHLQSRNSPMHLSRNPYYAGSM